MKKLLLAALLITAAFIMISCATTSSLAENETAEAAVDYFKISGADARALINTGKVIILDVRTVEEFKETRIAGAILIPDYEIRELAELMLHDKEAIILVYCRSGRRSEIASRALIEMGYQNVYDFGGIIDWEYETVSGPDFNSFRCFAF